MAQSTFEKVALYGGGALVVLGVFAIGLIEMLFGATHPVTGEGQIVHDALVSLEIRSYIIIAGFLLWGLGVLYKLVGPMETARTA
jgi:hypothetical protein